jgi:hypothetical protein
MFRCGCDMSLFKVQLGGQFDFSFLFSGFLGRHCVLADFRLRQKSGSRFLAQFAMTYSPVLQYVQISTVSHQLCSQNFFHSLQLMLLLLYHVQES